MEWAVAYHGTSQQASPHIAKDGLRAGGSEGGPQRANGAVHGPGIYCSPDCSVAAMYATPVLVESVDANGAALTKRFQVVFQCRVRGPGLPTHRQAEQSGSGGG